MRGTNYSRWHKEEFISGEKRGASSLRVRGTEQLHRLRTGFCATGMRYPTTSCIARRGPNILFPALGDGEVNAWRLPSVN